MVLELRTGGERAPHYGRIRSGVWLLGLLLAACAGPRAPRPAAPLDAVAQVYYAQAQQELWSGRGRAALALCDAAILREPLFVAAHRQRQNLLLAEGRRAQLLQEYGRLQRGAPDDARAHYLLGRLAVDFEAQAEAFEEARELDPGDPWPLLGLGHSLLSRGELTESIERFEQGLALAPDHRELRLGLAQARITARRWDEAARLLEADEVLHRDDDRRIHLLAELQRARPAAEGGSVRTLGMALAHAPGHPGHAQRLLVHLQAVGTRGDAHWLRRLLASRGGEPAPWAARVNSVLAEWTGDPEAALGELALLPSLSLEEHRRRRRLLAQLGRWSALIEAESRRFAALRQLGFGSAAFARASRLAARVEQGEADAQERLEFAQSLRAVGWTECALMSLRGVPESELDARHHSLVRDLGTQLRFEAELELEVERSYDLFDRSGERDDFDQFVASLSRAATRTLGVDVLAGSRVLEFGPIGSLIDPDPRTGGAWAEYFAERGRLVVAGCRAFHPPELLLVPALVHGRAGPQGAHLAFAEGWTVPSILHHRGAPIAGAALHRFVYVDVGSIAADAAALQARVEEDRRRWPGLLQGPIQPARGEAARRALNEPGDVTRKLQRRAVEDWVARGRPGGEHGLLAEAIEEVLLHETAHLEDAHEVLSSELPWLRAVRPLFAHGFSPARVEAWLEMRAQCAAVSRSRNPYLALSSCTEYMPSSRMPGSPHAAGYGRFLERFVALVDRDRGQLGGIDPEGVLLQQLDRLGPQQIRAYAREVAEELELPGRRP